MEGGNVNFRLKWKGEMLGKNFCFSFCFLLFKTTEICFGSTKMGIFYRKKAFHTTKKPGKIPLPPLKNISLTPLLGNKSHRPILRYGQL